MKNAKIKTKISYQWTEKAALELKKSGQVGKGEIEPYQVAGLVGLGYIRCCFSNAKEA